jgi:hypothetical protein
MAIRVTTSMYPRAQTVHLWKKFSHRDLLFWASLLLSRNVNWNLALTENEYKLACTAFANVASRGGTFKILGDFCHGFAMLRFLNVQAGYLVKKKDWRGVESGGYTHIRKPQIDAIRIFMVVIIIAISKA